MSTSSITSREKPSPLRPVLSDISGNSSQILLSYLSQLSNGHLLVLSNVGFRIVVEADMNIWTERGLAK